MQAAGNQHSAAKAFLLSLSARPGSRFPRQLTAGISGEGLDRERGGFKCHRHSVPGKRRDHLSRIANRKILCVLGSGSKSRDTAKRRGIQISASESFGKGQQSALGQRGQEQIDVFSATAFVGPEQTTNVYSTALNPGETDITIRAGKHLQIGIHRQTACMDLESHPSRIRPPPPSSRTHNPRTSLDTRRQFEGAAGLNKIRRQPLIETPARDTARGDFHFTKSSRAIGPARRLEALRIGKVRRDSQLIEHGIRYAADELSANPVTRITSRLVQDDIEAASPQCDAKRQSSEPPPCDDNLSFQRRQAIMRMTPCQWEDSAISHSDGRKPKAEAISPRRKPARMLAGMSCRVTLPTKGNASAERDRTRSSRHGSEKTRVCACEKPSPSRRRSSS